MKTNVKVELETMGRVGVSETCGHPKLMDLAGIEVHPDGPMVGFVGVNLLNEEGELPASFVLTRRDMRTLGKALIEASES